MAPESHDQNPNQAVKGQHAGDLTGDIREVPAREFRETPLHEAAHPSDGEPKVVIPETVEQGFTAYPLTAEEIAEIQRRRQFDQGTATETKPSRKRLPFIIGGGIATVAAIATAAALTFGSSSDRDPSEAPVPGVDNTAEPLPNNPEVTAPPVQPSPSPEITDSPGSEGETPSGDLSPEVLSQMTAQEIMEAFQINTDDISNPSDYTSVFVEKFEAMSNAGGTREQWLPYQNAGKGVYTQAMIDKYNSPTSLGLLGYELDPARQIVTNDRYNVSFMLGKEYRYNIDLLEETVLVTENADDSFDVRFTTHTTDTYDVKADIGDGPGTDPSDFQESWTLTGVRANDQGVLHPSTLDIQLLP